MRDSLGEHPTRFFAGGSASDSARDLQPLLDAYSHRLARVHELCDADRQDAVQATIVNLWRISLRHSRHGVGISRAYAYRSLSNTFKNLARSRRRRVAESLDLLIESGTDPASPFDHVTTLLSLDAMVAWERGLGATEAFIWNAHKLAATNGSPSAVEGSAARQLGITVQALRNRTLRLIDRAHSEIFDSPRSKRSGSRFSQRHGAGHGTTAARSAGNLRDPRSSRVCPSLAPAAGNRTQGMCARQER